MSKMVSYNIYSCEASIHLKGFCQKIKFQINQNLKIFLQQYLCIKIFVHQYLCKIVFGNDYMIGSSGNKKATLPWVLFSDTGLNFLIPENSCWFHLVSVYPLKPIVKVTSFWQRKIGEIIRKATQAERKCCDVS